MTRCSPQRTHASRPRAASPAARATPLGVSAALTAIVAFSFLNLVPKVAHASAVVFAFYRLWLGALVMLVASAATRRPPRWRTLRASAPGGVLFGLNLLFFFEALKRTGVADVLIIGSLQPALTLLVAGRMFGERIGRADVAWTFVSLAGVALAVAGSSGSRVWSASGDLFAAGALLAFTVYFLVSKRVRRSLSATEYMTGVTITAAVVVTPVALVTAPSLRVRPLDLLWLLLFVVVAQGGHTMLAWAHEQVDISVSSLLVLAEPVISAVAALVVLGEPLTALEVGGGLVAIASMGVVIRRATRRRPEEYVATPELE